MSSSSSIVSYIRSVYAAEHLTTIIEQRVQAVCSGRAQSAEVSPTTIITIIDPLLHFDAAFATLFSQYH
jgi:hypothetical protein